MFCQEMFVRKTKNKTVIMTTIFIGIWHLSIILKNIMITELLLVQVVSQIALEATDMGRPLYEKYGFVKMEDEMEIK